jgi:nitrate/nitrite-specific signal transduction histidine kinase
VSVQIIRIIQEALTNVRKHARANQACVQHLNGMIITGASPLRTTDKGRPAPSSEARAVSDCIMRERAEMSQLEIDSTHKGTQVVLRVPLASKK